MVSDSAPFSFNCIWFSMAFLWESAAGTHVLLMCIILIYTVAWICVTLYGHSKV